MPVLVLELRDNDCMIVNGASLRFPAKTRVELLGPARFVFGKQVMEPEQANTPMSRLYFAIQSAYAGAEYERIGRLEEARQLVAEIKKTSISAGEREILDEVLMSAVADDCYRALRILRKSLMKADTV